MAIRIEVLLH